MGCIDQLLEIFLEKTENRRSYRILHDIITRCTFIAAFENNMTLMFKECDAILLFECLRLKSLYQILRFPEDIVYNYSNLNISISSKILEKISRLLFQRIEMRSVLRNSRIYEEEQFQKEWNKADLHFTNAIHMTNETEN